MKTAKFLSIVMIVGFMSVILEGCSKKCSNEPPQARIINNGTNKASVQIKTSNGSTVNINNVDPSTTSAYASYAAGEITFTITVNSNNFVKVITMANCFNYDIAIDGNNNITYTSAAR